MSTNLVANTVLSYSFVVQVSKMAPKRLTLRCWQGFIPSGSSRGDFIFLLFPAPKATHIPWFMATFYPQSQLLHHSDLCICACIF